MSDTTDHYLSIAQMLLIVAGSIMLLAGLPVLGALYWAYTNNPNIPIDWNQAYLWVLKGAAMLQTGDIISIVRRRKNERKQDK